MKELSEIFQLDFSFFLCDSEICVHLTLDPLYDYTEEVPITWNPSLIVS